MAYRLSPTWHYLGLLNQVRCHDSLCRSTENISHPLSRNLSCTLSHRITRPRNVCNQTPRFFLTVMHPFTCLLTLSMDLVIYPLTLLTTFPLINYLSIPLFQSCSPITSIIDSQSLSPGSHIQRLFILVSCPDQQL